MIPKFGSAKPIVKNFSPKKKKKKFPLRGLRGRNLWRGGLGWGGGVKGQSKHSTVSLKAQIRAESILCVWLIPASGQTDTVKLDQLESSALKATAWTADRLGKKRFVDGVAALPADDHSPRVIRRDFASITRNDLCHQTTPWQCNKHQFQKCQLDLNKRSVGGWPATQHP